MRLTFLGKDTQGGNSPTLWETDDGQYVIQGFTLDAEALGQVGAIPDGGLDVSPLNIEAGEDIRYLPRHLTEDIELPDEDFWLLDDDTLILSVFSADGRTGGFAREPAPELLSECVAVRDQVWERAIPYAQYVA